MGFSTDSVNKIHSQKKLSNAGRFIENHPSLSQRMLEIFPGLTSWTILILPVILSFFHPAIVAYFIILFDVYFFYKSASMAIYSGMAYLKMTAHGEVDWLGEMKKHKDWENIHHLIIIPTYKEPAYKLIATLEHIAKNDFPTKKITIVLGMEEREGEPGKKRVLEIISKLGNKFANIWATYHPDTLGEVKGKASNEAYACKWAKDKLLELGHELNNVIVTSCDADSLLPSKYFSYLTNLFLSDSERYYHFYHAPVLLYSNFWEIPLAVRVKSTLDSISRMAFLMRPDKLIQVSTYSASLKLIDSVGYWDTDIIPEDWHIFLQAFFTYGERVRTIPIFLPIMGDAVRGPTYISTLKDRYEQERRWAWGVSDIPYAIKKYMTTPDISFWPKTIRLFRLLESHIFWPTNFFILTLGASIPPLINPAFSRTTLGHSLPSVSGFILTLSTVFLLILLIVDAKTRPPRPEKYNLLKMPLLLFQWVFLPIISLFFSSLPGLDAHTRLMLGKRLEYKVTEKV